LDDVPSEADTRHEIDHRGLSVTALAFGMDAVLGGTSPSELTMVQKARGAQGECAAAFRHVRRPLHHAVLERPK
jgi:hypothetical protein